MVKNFRIWPYRYFWSRRVNVKKNSLTFGHNVCFAVLWDRLCSRQKPTFSGLSFVCILQGSKLVLLREISWTYFDLFDSMPIHLLHSFPPEFSWENLSRRVRRVRRVRRARRARRVRRARRSRTRGPMRIEIYFCEGWEWSSRIRWLPPCSLGDIFWVHPSTVGALDTAWPSWI